MLVAKPGNPLQAIQLINSPTINGLRQHLQDAKDDDRVVGLIVHAVPSQTALAHGEEIAELVEDFGRTKPTMAWAEAYGELGQGLASYLLASAARTVWLQPTGALSIEGVELSITLLKGLFNKVGAEPQFGQRHEYKTAADTYAASEVTEPHREMMRALGESLVGEIVATVARRRQLDPATVWDGVNGSPLTADQALELGLIDRIGYRDEAYAATLAEWDADAEQLLYAHRYTNRAAMAKLAPSSRRSPWSASAAPSSRGAGSAHPWAVSRPVPTSSTSTCGLRCVTTR